MSSPDDIRWIAVVPSTELVPETPREIVIDENILVLIRYGDNIGAYQGLCPHQFARLSEGQVVDGQLNCPRHMARFRLSDGACGPGWSLPPLRRFAVKEEDGVVHISLQSLKEN